uniref:Uncharacterized protein n=1 Tax=Entomoneis paludosa TaxID=265537 RepID=A0A7S2YEW5_9STRA
MTTVTNALRATRKNLRQASQTMDEVVASITASLGTRDEKDDEKDPSDNQQAEKEEEPPATNDKEEEQQTKDPHFPHPYNHREHMSRSLNDKVEYTSRRIHAPTDDAPKDDSESDKKATTASNNSEETTFNEEHTVPKPWYRRMWGNMTKSRTVGVESPPRKDDSLKNPSHNEEKVPDAQSSNQNPQPSSADGTKRQPENQK